MVTSFVKFLQLAVMLYNLKGNIDSFLFPIKLFLDYCEITTNFRYEVGKSQLLTLSHDNSLVFRISDVMMIPSFLTK